MVSSNRERNPVVPGAVEDMTIITERYGSHILTITYYENSAKVTVEDLAEIKFPLIYSDIMTKGNANAYLEIFRACGYIEVA